MIESVSVAAWWREIRPVLLESNFRDLGHLLETTAVLIHTKRGVYEWRMEARTGGGFCGRLVDVTAFIKTLNTSAAPKMVPKPQAAWVSYWWPQVEWNVVIRQAVEGGMVEGWKTQGTWEELAALWNDDAAIRARSGYLTVVPYVRWLQVGQAFEGQRAAWERAAQAKIVSRIWGWVEQGQWPETGEWWREALGNGATTLTDQWRWLWGGKPSAIQWRGHWALVVSGRCVLGIIQAVAMNPGKARSGSRFCCLTEWGGAPCKLSR